MKITYFFRHPRPEYNSLEEVFGSVIHALPEEVETERKEAPATGASWKALWKNIRFARQNRGELNHITGDVHYLALAMGKNTVLTIHDAYSALRGNLLKRWFVKLLWFWLPALCVRRITTISPKSAKELEKVIPFAKKKIRVVPNPFSAELWVEEQGARNKEQGTRSQVLGGNSLKDEAWDGAGKPIILHLGTKANKNLERTIQALQGVGCRLVIIGKLSEDQLDLLKKHTIDFESHFNLPFKEVADLYRRSDVVCFASLYEGFGMPIIEAQAVGKPVVTSDIDPMNWVAHNAACLVDPYNTQSIREGILKVLNDSEYRDELVRRGKENTRRFEPRKIAEMYLQVYREVEAESSKVKGKSKGGSRQQQ